MWKLTRVFNIMESSRTLILTSYNEIVINVRKQTEEFDIDSYAFLSY